MDQMTSIKNLIEPVLATMNLHLYELVWRQEGNARILQIAIMREDGTMDIDTCSEVSEKLSEVMDEKDIITSEYFLEVCSPGAERELRSDADIERAIHEFIYIKFKNPKLGLDEVKGTLMAVQGDLLKVDYMAKAVKKHIEIEKDNIAKITLAVKI